MKCLYCCVSNTDIHEQQDFTHGARHSRLSSLCMDEFINYFMAVFILASWCSVLVAQCDVLSAAFIV